MSATNFEVRITFFGHIFTWRPNVEEVLGKSTTEIEAMDEEEVVNALRDIVLATRPETEYWPLDKLGLPRKVEKTDDQ